MLDIPASIENWRCVTVTMRLLQDFWARKVVHSHGLRPPKTCFTKKWKKVKSGSMVARNYQSGFADPLTNTSTPFSKNWTFGQDGLQGKSYFSQIKLPKSNYKSMKSERFSNTMWVDQEHILTWKSICRILL